MKASLVLPLLFLGASGHTSMVMAQSPGTFTPTDNMITASISQWEIANWRASTSRSALANRSKSTPNSRLESRFWLLG
jgi:hypothetical protein